MIKSCYIRYQSKVSNVIHAISKVDNIADTNKVKKNTLIYCVCLQFYKLTDNPSLSYWQMHF